MRAYWYTSKNVGDTLSPIILEHFLNRKITLCGRNCQGKILAVGSIMKALRPNDIVWGAGIMRQHDKFKLANNKILAVRGKLTEQILNVDCGVYGDPALLLPLMYDPEVKKTYKVGIVEHYVDKGLYKGEGYRINVLSEWREFVKQIKSCKKIISSSLHGCIIAEAYGIKTEWVKLSDKVLGDGFKFKDYLSATDRTSFNQFLTKNQLKKQQEDLIRSLKSI